MNFSDPDFPAHGAFQWRKKGYFFEIPLGLRTQRDQLKVDSSNEWLALLAVFEEAKQGVFSSVIRLLDVTTETDDPVLLRAAVQLLGDASPNSLLKRHVPNLLNRLDLPLQIELCHALWGSRMLWAASILADVYLSSTDRRESLIIPTKLARMLGLRQIAISAEEGIHDAKWRELVFQRYQQLQLLLGDDDIPVIDGEVYGIKKVASNFLRAIQLNENITDADLMALRHDFESATGIDCREMFHEGMPQLLVAAVILERFLNSPEAAEYKDGVRYFFGHRIPD